jgi:hypothetical protein
MAALNASAFSVFFSLLKMRVQVSVKNCAILCQRLVGKPITNEPDASVGPKPIAYLHEGSKLEPASDQFQPSDVTFWGVVALACGAVAVVAANIGALLPPETLLSLHASRQSVGMEQLQLQVARLETESQRLSQEGARLQTLVSMTETGQNVVSRRVGALEATVPKLSEAVAPGTKVDTTIRTAGIGTPEAESFEAEGGTISISQRPMTGLEGKLNVTNAQPLPAMPAPVEATPEVDPRVFGLALGPSVTDTNAKATWDDLSLKMGALMMGLSPLVAGADDAPSKRLIVGPIPDMIQAADMCRRMEKVSVSCSPVPFLGKPL